MAKAKDSEVGLTTGLEEGAGGRSVAAGAPSGSLREPPSPGGEDFLPVPLRPRADGWTPERQRAFLENLAACGSVAAAARSVGLSRESAYALRRRADARGFAQAWDAARLLANEHLVEVAWDRALNGVIRPIYYHGELVGEVVHHDSRLLLGLIAQNRALAERAQAGQGAGGGALASGGVLGAVLDDWEAALERVERGEALAEPGAEGLGAEGLGEGQAEGAPLPPPLPPETDAHGEPLSEAQQLEVGIYGHWWQEDLDGWLTNWPTPEDWAGEQFRIDWSGEAVALSPEEAERALDGEAEPGPAHLADTVPWARSLSAAEEAGLEAAAEAAVDLRERRLELYRRAAFGLASAAERAAIAAANGGCVTWGER